jgi:hypothetical protein
MKQSLAIICTATALGLVAYAFYDHSLLAGIAAAIFLGLAFVFLVQDQILKREMVLGQDELHRWGDDLADATPEILERTSAGEHALVVAKSMESDRSIPREVVLKYIIALGEHGRR